MYVLAKKFSEKIEQKGLQSILSDLQVAAIYLGKVPPEISQITMMKPESVSSVTDLVSLA